MERKFNKGPTKVSRPFIDKDIKEEALRECPHSKKCGCCSLLGQNYTTQLKYKKRLVESALADNGIEAKTDDTVGMFYPFEYRNKIHLAVQRVNSNIRIGFFEEESNTVADVESCRLHDKWAQKLITAVKEYIREFKIEPYDKETGKGIIRFVAARCIDDNILVTLVVASRNFAGKEYFYDKLKQNFKSAGLYLNINKRTDNAVFDKSFIHCAGLTELEGTVAGVKFSLHPAAFFQVNTQMAAKIYKRIAECVETGSGKTANGNKQSGQGADANKKTAKQKVLDLYSGIGISSVLFAKNGAEVTAVEISKPATVSAENIAKINGADKSITIFNSPCESVLSEADNVENQDAAKSKTQSNKNKTITDVKVRSGQKYDAVFLDPSRAGAGENVMIAIKKLSPDKIIYLSCNPVSLAKDLQNIITDYSMVSVTPYDMFPQTDHVETLVCLHRK